MSVINAVKTAHWFWQHVPNTDASLLQNMDHLELRHHSLQQMDLTPKQIP